MKQNVEICSMCILIFGNTCSSIFLLYCLQYQCKFNKLKLLIFFHITRVSGSNMHCVYRAGLYDACCTNDEDTCLRTQCSDSGKINPYLNYIFTHFNILKLCLTTTKCIWFQLTNNIVRGDGDQMKPALGRSWVHCPNTRLLITRDQPSTKDGYNHLNSKQEIEKRHVRLTASSRQVRYIKQMFPVDMRC